MDKIKQNKFLYIGIIIVLIQIIYITYCFSVLKQDYHSDEIWTYGLANSSNGPYIYMTNDRSKQINAFEWTDSEVLKEYITIDNSEIFNYKMVFDNCADDWHPPLYFFLVHFVSSIFTGIWSKWFAYVINLLSFIIMQFYLYKLVNCITEDNTYSLISIAFYGLTMGANEISIYLRDYSLAVMFCVIFCYYATLIFNNRNTYIEWRYFIYLAVSCLLGGLTIHLFLLPAFIITFLYCLTFLIGKKINLMFKFGLSCTIGVALSYIIFFPSFSHMFGDSSEFIGIEKYSMWLQFKMYWSYLNRDIIGIHNSILPTMTDTYFIVGLFVAIIICISILFLFRNEEWLKKFEIGLKNRIQNLGKSDRKAYIPILVLLSAVLFTILINSKITSILEMGIYANRYNFVIYPIYTGFIVTFLYYIIKWLINKKSVFYALTSFLLLGFLILGYILKTDAYYFNFYKEDVTLEKIENDANTVLFLSMPFLITSASNKLMNTGNFYFTDVLNYDKGKNYNDIDIDNHPLYLVLDNNCIKKDDSELNDITVDKETLQKPIENKDAVELEKIIVFYSETFDKNVTYVGTDTLFGRTVYLFRLD